jgi:tagatose 6-phosphate kinase
VGRVSPAPHPTGPIVTVTCNPALDVTYQVDRLVPNTVHRVSGVQERPGGKGVNVARVLHQLGVPVVATGLADDTFGDRAADVGVTAAFVPALPTVRRTLVVQSATGTTGLWEPGAEPSDPAAAAAALVDRVADLVRDAAGLVVSGSLPPGVDDALPADLARLARDAGLPVLLDLDDAPLRTALARGGAVLTPNLDELARLLGQDGDPPGPDQAAAAARALAERNGAPVVVTLGPGGLVAATAERSWRAAPPEEVVGNPTGAGDAAAAAIIRGLAGRVPWPEIVADAVALSAAAVASPVAGEVDLDHYRTGRGLVRPVDVHPPTRRS